MTELRTLRRRCWWSIEAASAVFNVNERTWRRWEAGQNTPPPHILAALRDIAVTTERRVAKWLEENPPRRVDAGEEP